MTDTEIPREERFFNRIKREQVLVEVLDRHGFSPPKPYERVRNPNDSLRFEKPSWQIPAARGALDSIKMYFESVQRGDLRLRVDVDPHRERLTDTMSEARRSERELARERRSKLLFQIRRKLLAEATLDEQLGINARSLRRPEGPYTMTAVKFDLGLSPDCTPEECARAYALAIDRVAPLVDRVLAGRRRA